MKINTYNDKRQKHGYCKEYYFAGKPWFDANYINGKEIGYSRTYHYFTSEIIWKQYTII